MLAFINIMNLDAQTSVQLIKILQSVDVPLSTIGRTTEHTEYYAISFLLCTLDQENGLDYPLSLIHVDRPDFVLSLPNENIGIEHTEAVPQNEAAKDALREQGVGPGMHFLSRVVPGGKRRKSKQLVREVVADAMTDGWLGDQTEVEWADAMKFFLDEKLLKLRKNRFAKHEENWLLMYDNWPLPAINRKLAASYFHKRLLGQQVEFDRIYILSDAYLYEVLRDSASVFPVNNLWKQANKALLPTAKLRGGFTVE